MIIATVSLFLALFLPPTQTHHMKWQTTWGSSNNISTFELYENESSKLLVIDHPTVTLRYLQHNGVIWRIFNNEPICEAEEEFPTYNNTDGIAFNADGSISESVSVTLDEMVDIVVDPNLMGANQNTNFIWDQTYGFKDGQFRPWDEHVNYLTNNGYLVQNLTDPTPGTCGGEAPYILCGRTQEENPLPCPVIRCYDCLPAGYCPSEKQQSRVKYKVVDTPFQNYCCAQISAYCLLKTKCKRLITECTPGVTGCNGATTGEEYIDYNSDIITTYVMTTEECFGTPG